MRRLALALVGAILVAGCGSSASPTPAPTLTAAPTDILAPSDAPPSASPAETPSASSSPDVTPAPTKKPAGTKSYKVKKNDTFYSIAKKYGITVEALQAANPKVKATALKIGTVLSIPPKR